MVWPFFSRVLNGEKGLDARRGGFSAYAGKNIFCKEFFMNKQTMRTLIRRIAAVLCVVVVSLVLVCCGGADTENWMSFSSSGEFAGSITSFRHHFINRSSVTIEIQFYDRSITILSGSERDVIVNNSNTYSLSCKVHASDDRDLKIDSGGFKVVFYDK
jgi:hypothetical protein